MKTTERAPDDKAARNAPEGMTKGTLPVRAANEDSPTGGVLYRMISRRPDRNIIGNGMIAALFVLAVGGFLLWRHYGMDGLLTLGEMEMALIGLALATPLALIFMLTYTIWRGQEMRLMSEALARTAIRLSDPEDFASDQINSISGAVQRELGTMQAGLDTALARAEELRALIAQEVEEIDRGTGRAEFRTRTMEELLNRHKNSLQELSRKLGAESDAMSRTLREQVDAVRSIAGQAENNIDMASQKLAEQAEALARTSEAARAGADQTASMLDRQSSRLEVVAGNALDKAKEIGERYEAQREIIIEATKTLQDEQDKLQAAFDMQQQNMQEADKALARHTTEINRAVASLSAGLDVTFEAAAARAVALRESIAEEIRRGASEAADVSTSVSRSAGAATRALGATVDELKAAAGALSNGVNRAATEAIEATTRRLGEATETLGRDLKAATERLSEDIVSRTEELRKLAETTLNDSEEASERFNAAMIRLGGAARDAGSALHDATDELSARMNELPKEATDSVMALKDVLEEQIGALAAIAEIVVRHSRMSDRAMPVMRDDFAPRATTPPPAAFRAAELQPQRRWGIQDLLAAAERRHGGRGKAETASPDGQQDFQRASLHVIETLQALAIDLDRALEQSPSPELWQRYQAGERNVFTRRLYNLAGRELHDRIATKYGKDSEFRANVDHFIASFEDLLGEASLRDRDNILVNTYLTSDTGKVYLMLGQAIGKLR